MSTSCNNAELAEHHVPAAPESRTLREIKESHQFDDWALVRMGRLSTMSAPTEFWAWLQKQGTF